MVSALLAGCGGSNEDVPPDVIVLEGPKVVSITHTPTTVVQGQKITVKDSIKNPSEVITANFAVGIFLSTDSNITRADVLLGYRTVKGLGKGLYSSGGSDLTVNAAPGTYYIGAIADFQNFVQRGSESSRTMRSESNSSQLIVTKPVSDPADLIMTYMTHWPYQVEQGQSISVSTTAENIGRGDATSFRVGIYASKDSKITTSDTLIGHRSVSSLAKSKAHRASGSIKISLPAGTYYVGTLADDTGDVTESEEGNNSLLSESNSAKLTVKQKISTPDLIMSSLRHSPPSLTQQDDVSMPYTVKNQGVGAAGSFTVTFYASSNSSITTSDTRLGSVNVTSLARGATSSGTKIVSVSLSPGVYYIGAIADSANTVFESNESNNSRTSTSYVGKLTVNKQTTPRPDLAMVAMTHTPSSVERGRYLSISETVRNLGTAAAGSFRVGIYASTNKLISQGDYLLGYRVLGGLGQGKWLTAKGTFKVTIPAGTYYMGVIADDKGAVAESNEANNTRLSASFSSKLTVTKVPVKSPDLIMQSLTHTPTSVIQGHSITISDKVKNQGLATATGFYVGIYASKDSTITKADTRLGQRYISSLAQGLSNSKSGTLKISISAGTYYIGAIVDAANTVAEMSETNNTIRSSTNSARLTVFAAKPDLIPTRCYHSKSSVSQGDSISMSLSVKNQGTATSGGFRIGVYASTNTTISTQDTLIGYQGVSSRGVGSYFHWTGPIKINLSPGRYYLGTIADYSNQVAESNESNNVKRSTNYSSVLDVKASKPDLTLTKFYHTKASVVQQQTVTLSYTIKNQGTSRYLPTRIGFYASTNKVFTTFDSLIGSVILWTGLGAGKSYSNSKTVTVGLPKGNYYIFAYADDKGQWSESVENNNIKASTSFSGKLQVLAKPNKPDLTPTALTHSRGYAYKAMPFNRATFSYSVKNLGTTSWSAFRIGIYASTNTTITPGDVLLGSDIKVLGLGAGKTYSNQWSTFIGKLSKGTWYIGIMVDDKYQWSESNEYNQTMLSTKFSSKLIIK